MRWGLAIVVLALFGTACSGGTPDPAAEDVEALIEQYGVTTAELEDLRFVAQENGWTLTEALNRVAWQPGFADFVQELRDEYPKEYAAAAILPEVGPRSVFIAFRSDVPDEVRNDPRLDQLEVEFRDHQGFNESDLVEQNNTLFYLLLDAGFPDVHAFPDPSTGFVMVDVERRPEDAGKSDSEIKDGLPVEAHADNVRIAFFDSLPDGGEDVANQLRS